MTKGPQAWKPSVLYLMLAPHLTEVAQKHGYALAIHGSLQHDFDVVAFPWVEDAAAPEDLVRAFCEAFAVAVVGHERRALLEGVPPPELKPHGRMAWIIVLSLGSMDLSVMPRTGAMGVKA